MIQLVTKNLEAKRKSDSAEERDTAETIFKKK